MNRILIVEDDLTIAHGVADHLSRWGYDCCVAPDFSDIMATFEKVRPQLVILDITLPFFNGYHWCQSIRRVSNVPILFLSSSADNMNIVMAVDMGGDDFIAKPFDLDVLTAKIGALIRRCYDLSPEPPALSVRGAVLDTDAITLCYRDARLELTKNEYRILQVLMERAGQVVGRDTLMEKLWETDVYIDDNTLTVNVGRLRKRLESIGLGDFIQTKRGMGYLIAREDSAGSAPDKADEPGGGDG